MTTLEKASAGAGFVAAAGVPVTFTLTNSNGAVAYPAGPVASTPDAHSFPTRRSSDLSAGQVTGSASTTFTLNGVILTRETGDGLAGDSADAVKTFEDANISKTRSATN